MTLSTKPTIATLFTAVVVKEQKVQCDSFSNQVIALIFRMSCRCLGEGSGATLAKSTMVQNPSFYFAGPLPRPLALSLQAHFESCLCFLIFCLPILFFCSLVRKNAFGIPLHYYYYFLNYFLFRILHFSSAFYRPSARLRLFYFQFYGRNYSRIFCIHANDGLQFCGPCALLSSVMFCFAGECGGPNILSVGVLRRRIACCVGCIVGRMSIIGTRRY